MRSSLLGSAAIAALLAAGCSGPTPGADQFPADLSISPSIGPSSAPTAVVIKGTGFLARASQPSGGGQPTLETHHRAWLGTSELTVTWQDTTTLDATVPAGLEPGVYDLTVENAIGNRGQLKAAYTVLAAPVFEATASVDHPNVNVNQQFTFTLTVTNHGSSDITSFALGPPTVSSTDGGSATSTGTAPSAPARLAAGETQTFTWTYTAGAAASHISIDVAATGVDSFSGQTVTASLAAPVAVNIQLPAALTATWTVSQSLQTVNVPVTLTLNLANRTQAATARVTGIVPSLSSSTSSSPCTPAQPQPTTASPVLLAGGEARSFTWTCTASVFGAYTASAAVTATDSNDASSTPAVTGLAGIGVTYTEQLVVSVAIAGNGSGTVSASPSGTPAPGITRCSTLGATNCSATFVNGTHIVFTATPSAGSSVTWTDCDTASGNTCTINSLAGPKAVTATFTLQTFTVAVTATGTGSGTVASSPAGISACAVAGGGTCSASFNYGTAVTLTASPAAGSTVAWTGCDTSSGNTCTLNAITAAKSVRATFTLGSNNLTTSTTGNGTGSITCNGVACASSYPYGTVVDLTPTPGAGSSFTGWSEDCSGTGPCSVTMTAVHSVTANFTLQTFAVSVSPTGTGGGTVASSPAGIGGCAVGGGGTCSASFNYGTSVTLTASPTAGSSVTWAGCDSTSGNTCALHVTAVKSVTATFTLSSNILTVNTAGTGTGSVTCDGVACLSSYPYGTVVNLAQTPGAGSSFTGWSGACSGTGACSVTMTAARSVTATFTLQTFAVSVTPTGTGGGTVASSPVGIGGCAVGGGGTCSASFTYGAAVTLTASPTAGSSVTWAGCDSSIGNTCTLNVTAAKGVTATFTLGSNNLGVSTVGDGTGSITCDGVPCLSSYPYGTIVTLAQTPGSGSSFTGWTGACSGTGACSVTMTTARSVTASFMADRTITVSVTGLIGTVTGGGISCSVGNTGTCSTTIPYNGAITLDSGTGNMIWGGACEGVNGASCTLSNITSSTDVTAQYP